jgi:hypothetical protein
MRQQVLRLCGDVSPLPGITFAGPVDQALPPEAMDPADRGLGAGRRSPTRPANGPDQVPSGGNRLV